MIEAYEIGIRLALDDEISAGVQAIRRELVELDRVIEASSVKLASLRAAAGFVAAPSVAEPPRREADPEPEEATQAPARDAARTVEPAEEQPPEAAVRPPTGRLGPASERLADAPASAPKPSSSERRDAPAEPAVDRASYWIGSASAQDASAPRAETILPNEAAEPADEAPFSRTAAAPPAPGSIEERQAAPSPIASAPLRERGTMRSAELPHGDAATRSTAAASAPTSPPALPAPERVRPPRAATVAEAAPSRAVAPNAPLRTPSPPRRAGGAAIFRAPGAARETVSPEPAAPDRQPAAAKSGEDADQRTMEVYIYLEGAPLGRWMTDHLDRAASRPAASVTGFDPRVGPAWPGAPIG